MLGQMVPRFWEQHFSMVHKGLQSNLLPAQEAAEIILSGRGNAAEVFRIKG